MEEMPEKCISMEEEVRREARRFFGLREKARGKKTRGTGNEDNFDGKSREFELGQVFEEVCRRGKERGEAEVHLAAIKQFWLDCGVCSMVFFHILMAPVRDKQWLRREDFLRSLESFQQKNLVLAFLPEQKKKQMALTMKIQKMLCKG
jgi:hypothetical protein